MICNCILTNTRQVAIRLDYASNTRIESCTIVKSAEFFGGVSTGRTTITSSIATGVDSFGTGNPTITYSDFFDDGFALPPGTGNLDVDPLFADPGSGDFHLRSQFGRWDGAGWTTDATTSPVIGAGDPASDNSKSPWGGVIEMGAYGNTPEASKPAHGTFLWCHDAWVLDGID